jgi:serine/threonine-protein kinase HipA
MARSTPHSLALDVRWYDGRLVGRVVSPGPVYFAYDAGWLANGVSLSPLSLPFTTETYRQRADAFDQLPGVLSDCLPDAWGRRVMDRDLSTRHVRPTPLKRLAWVGRRGIGALQFEPALDAKDPPTAWEDIAPGLLAREAGAVLHDEPAQAFRHLRLGGSPGGALPKATVAILPNGSLLTGGDVAAAILHHPNARLGILKLHEHEAAEGRSTDGRLEFAYLLMARAAGIHAANAEVLTDGHDHHLFVERFDCEPATPRRFHLLTLAGALNSHALTYRHLLDATRRLTADHTQVREAVRRMCFNVRSVNLDDHGKNHSFRYDESRAQWLLSPAYDLTFNGEEGRSYRGLTPETFGPSPRLETLAAVAADFGIGRGEFDEIDDAVSAAVARWSEFASQAVLPEQAARVARDAQLAMTSELSAASVPRRGRRRKLWE